MSTEISNIKYIIFLVERVFLIYIMITFNFETECHFPQWPTCRRYLSLLNHKYGPFFDCQVLAKVFLPRVYKLYY